MQLITSLYLLSFSCRFQAVKPLVSMSLSYMLLREEFRVCKCIYECMIW